MVGPIVTLGEHAYETSGIGRFDGLNTSFFQMNY